MLFQDINTEKIQDVVNYLLLTYSEIPIWTFEGNLGAGKTTLIKLLAKELGLQDDVSSPTFNYVNEYDGKIYHFDGYRLEHIEQVLQFGFEEYFDSGKKCWIEWPQVFEPLLPRPYLRIEITPTLDMKRTYTISVID